MNRDEAKSSIRARITIQEKAAEPDAFEAGVATRGRIRIKINERLITHHRRDRTNERSLDQEKRRTIAVEDATIAFLDAGVDKPVSTHRGQTPRRTIIAIDSIPIVADFVLFDDPVTTCGQRTIQGAAIIRYFVSVVARFDTRLHNAVAAPSKRTCCQTSVVGRSVAVIAEFTRLSEAISAKWFVETNRGRQEFRAPAGSDEKDRSEKLACCMLHPGNDIAIAALWKGFLGCGF